MYVGEFFLASADFGDSCTEVSRVLHRFNCSGSVLFGCSLSNSRVNCDFVNNHCVLHFYLRCK
jgi:hypothetical protein